MQPSSQQLLTCPTCGAALEETFGGGGGSMFCLLQAGIGSEQEVAQDSTQDSLEGGVRFGVYEIDCHADGSLCELGRGARGRLVSEARAAAALSHEHIATVEQFGMGLGTGQYFYAMELAEGETV